MERSEALEIAKANYERHTKADIENMFRSGPDFDAFELFGYRHGWYIAAGHAFNLTDIKGYEPVTFPESFR